MEATQPARWHRRLLTAVAATTVLAVAVAALYQPWLAQWGSSVAERQGAVVGDHIVDADLVWTRSITIDATPEAVWPWLVQMGVDRGGFYNYDWGEQLFGDPVHNATTIHPEWQNLEVGDAIHPFPGQDWIVTALEPNRALLLINPAVTPTDWSWATELRPLGKDRTRVVTRIRSENGSVLSYLLGPPDLILFPRLLTGLKQRAEGTLPGMPRTHTGKPFPLARLPVHWWAATVWLVGLGVLAIALRGALGLGRWRANRPRPHLLFWTGFVAGSGYLLMSDTPPVQFLTNRWAAGVVVGTAAGLTARRFLPGTATRRRCVSRGVSSLVETGLFVLLPATAVWQAATALGWTTTVAADVIIGVAAAVASTLIAAAAWKASPSGWRPAAAFAAVLAVSYVSTGSGLAALQIALIAELLPKSRATSPTNMDPATVGAGAR